jgi:serine/threonine protein kinase
MAIVREQTEGNVLVEFPSNFGSYSYLRTLGCGSFAVVVLVVHVPTQEQWACKVVPRSKMQDDAVLQRFIQEIDILQSVEHQSIVKIKEVLYTDQNLFIVTEYCPNGELSTYLSNAGELQFPEIQKFFFQIIHALYFLHERGVAHRDIKLDNILLDEENNLRLADFGFSRYSDGSSLMETPCGSPYYAAPEILCGKSYDGTKSDIWSAGVVLYILATGKVPWTATNRKHLYQQISHAQFTVPPYLDVDISITITSCLKPNPANRPSAYELLFFPLLKPVSGDILVPIMKNKHRKLTSVTMTGPAKDSSLHSLLYKQSAARSLAYIRQLKKDVKSDGVETLPAFRPQGGASAGSSTLTLTELN